ncbi:MAG TPA: phosphotransferase [Xanthomonadaceae bacterium]|nr:phosphotransferase [Xanthomonadaceae bacterium]
MNHPLDLPDVRLAAWLERHVDGFRGPLTATKFKGGQSNPTYLIEAASGRYVLRRKPPGELLASAHAVDREFRVIGALHGGAVPVARPLHLCTDDTVIGSWFYLMEFVDGRSFWDPALPDLPADQRGAVYREMVRVMAALHSVDVDAVGLADYGSSGDYFERQVARWTRQYRASETGRIEAMEALIDWLPSVVPGDGGARSLVHGDFRIDNLIFDRASTRVLAVVDWELSTLGHPLADLAYLCMCLRLPRNPVIPGLAGLDRAELGIPDEASMIADYRALGGMDAGDAWPFHLAFNFFRLAGIAQGVYKRAEQGNASSDQALAAGHMTGMLARMGCEAAGLG